MKRIALGLIMVLGLSTLVVGITKAIFSSQAVLGVNTFSSGTLDIRLNGQSHLTGFTFENAAPGACKTGNFGINNYGAPFFAGPSTLSAKELVISVEKTEGSDDLYQALKVKLEANRGWPTWMMVFDGSLNNVDEEDLLDGRWSDLAAGNSEDVKYEVCLPSTADNSLQGKSVKFNFVVDAYNPHR